MKENLDLYAFKLSILHEHHLKIIYALHIKASVSAFRSHHRKCAEKYLSDLNAEIDQIAEVDGAYFWKKVNGRRKLSTMCAGNELDFNGRILCDPEEISEAWGSFFEDLYSYSNCEYFDPMFQNIVDTRIAAIMHELSSPSDRDSVNFTDAVIRKVLNPLVPGVSYMLHFSFLKP